MFIHYIFILFFLISASVSCVHANEPSLLTVSACVSRALHYSETSVQLKQKDTVAQLNYTDFYRKNFNYTLALSSSVKRSKDLSYSFYEYYYDTRSEKASLTDSDAVETSVDLEVTKQFEFATKATFYKKISTNSSFSRVDKDGDFSDTTLDQYSSYESKSYLYNPEAGVKLEHYLLGKKPDELKFSLKNQQYKFKQSQLNNNAKKLDLINKTMLAYYTYALSLKIFEFKLMSYTEATRAKDFCKKVYDLGQISKYDYNKAEIELLQSNAEKENAHAECMNNKKKLMNIIGMPASTDVSIPPVIYTDFELDLENCRQLLFRSQPDIEITQLKLNKVNNDITLSKQEFLPDIKVFAEVGFEGNDKELSDSYKQMKNKWNIGFDVNYTLYDFNTRDRKLKIARSQLVELRSQLQEKHNELTIQLESAYSKLRQSEKTVTADIQKVLLAKENMDFMQKKYYGGQADIDDYIDAKKQYYSSEIKKLNSYLKAFTARIHIEKLIKTGLYAMEN